MQYKYKDKKLQKLAQGEFVKEYSSDTTLVRAFHKCINQIKTSGHYTTKATGKDRNAPSA